MFFSPTTRLYSSFPSLGFISGFPSERAGGMQGDSKGPCSTGSFFFPRWPVNSLAGKFPVHATLKTLCSHPCSFRALQFETPPSLHPSFYYLCSPSTLWAPFFFSFLLFCSSVLDPTRFFPPLPHRTYGRWAPPPLLLFVYVFFFPVLSLSRPSLLPF